MKLSLLWLFVIGSCSVQAQNNKTTAVKIVNKDSLTFDSLAHKIVFKLNNTTFSGAGWDLLTTEINKAQFVLIGEQHGEAEVPLFTGKVAEILKPKALVIEIDPYTANELKKVGSDQKLYNKVLKENPYAFSFYSWQQEMDLITKLQLTGADIWGLNEINFLSIGTFFNTLSDNAKSVSNKKAAATLAKQSIDNDQPIYAGGNFSKLSVFQLKESTVDSLLLLFKNESAICKKMLTDLKMSLPIFKNTSYQKRVNLMQKNLLNYLHNNITADAIEVPKLLFKFGANHVTRTNDLTNTFEVGNLADQLAGAAGTKTLHILVFGKSGTINNMTVADNKKAVESYDLLNDKDLKMFGQFTAPVVNDEWAVYDLRLMRKAIKAGKYQANHAQIKAMAMGYDLLVTFAKTTASRFIE